MSNVRRQTIRKRTINREVLESEHEEDVSLHDSLTEDGLNYERASRELKEKRDELENNERLSREDKAKIIQEIDRTLETIKANYEETIHKNLNEIEESMYERLAEMEDARQFWSDKKYEMKGIDLAVTNIDRKSLDNETENIIEEHSQLLQQAKEDLKRKEEISEAQRYLIHRNTSRR